MVLIQTQTSLVSVFVRVWFRVRNVAVMDEIKVNLWGMSVNLYIVSKLFVFVSVCVGGVTVFVILSRGSFWHVYFNFPSVAPMKTSTSPFCAVFWCLAASYVSTTAPELISHPDYEVSAVPLSGTVC